MNLENNISLLSALMLYGGIQSLFLALLLLKSDKKNISANRFLAIIVAGLGLTLLHQFLVDSSYINLVPYLTGITIPLDFIYSPALYLYVRTITQANTSNQKFAWHFLYVIIGFLLYTPFYNLDANKKIEFITNNYATIPENITTSFSLGMILSGIVFTVYLVLSIKLLLSHTQKINQFFSYREKINLTWLRNLLLISIIFWVFLAFFYSYLVSSQSKEQIGLLFNWFFIFTVFAAIYIGIMGLLQRKIYDSQDSNSETGDKKQTKYAHSALTAEMSLKLLKRLTNIMEQQRPYLKNNLTLPELAELTATSPNYLSQIINEQLHMNFFDYVNSYRIDTAKHLIIKPLAHTKTILDIAMESAFNSKSAFYTAFKKQTGMTPAQFKKNHQNIQSQLIQDK
ncbi:MAG: helix-turn-helix domain-containing protein [Gammaproteobacteria bacterium]